MNHEQTLRQAPKGRRPGSVPLAYVAHTLTNEAMRMVARQWVAKIVEWYPSRAIVAPWLLYLDALPPGMPGARARYLRDEIAILGVCQELWLVGGSIDADMAEMLAAARRLGLTVYNVTGSVWPPGHAPAALLPMLAPGACPP